MIILSFLWCHVTAKTHYWCWVSLGIFDARKSDDGEIWYDTVHGACVCVCVCVSVCECVSVCVRLCMDVSLSARAVDVVDVINVVNVAKCAEKIAVVSVSCTSSKKSD